VPMSICTAQADSVVEIQGTGFLQVGTMLPTVAIRNTSMDVFTTPMPVPSGCSPIVAELGAQIQSCTKLTITIPMGQVQPGSYTLLVTNPAPAACASTQIVPFVVNPPPTISALVPARLCAGGGTITVQGTGFLQGATTTITKSGSAPPMSVAATPTTVTSMTEADAVFSSAGGGFIPADKYDLTFQNADGCKDTRPMAITIVPGPIVFNVDPPFVYGGITTPVTVYTTGLTAPTAGMPLRVILRAQAGGATFDMSASSAIDATHTKRVIMNVPPTVPAGVYDLELSDGTGCPAVYANAVTVVTTTTPLVSITPPFGHSTANTDVSIRSNAFFVAGARAYLAPDAAATPVAVTLRSVEFQSSSELTGIVAGASTALALGQYDVIVVNPTGTIGLLDKGFRVVASATPVIERSSPGSLPTNCTTCTVGLSGVNFAAAPTITATCTRPDNTVSTTMPTVNAAPAPTTEKLFFNLTAVTSLPAGTVCTFRLTQADGADTVFTDGGVVVVTNPAANLGPTTAGSNLTSARRAPGLAFNGPTAARRNLYVIGGDTATSTTLATTALDSVEVAPADGIRGSIGAFTAIPYAGVAATTQGRLPSGRTLAGAVSLGRYIYLVGGHNGTASTTSVLRTMVLDPSEAPELDDADLNPDPVNGLEPGLYFYRVAAVMTPGDTRNPGGESLASDEFAIRVPTFGGNKIQVTLTWAAGAGSIASYRIYRTSTPNAQPGSEDVVFETSAATPRVFIDKGQAMTPFAAGKPLPFGAIGNWASGPSLNTARAGVGVALAKDPAGLDDDSGRYYIYAGYGFDSAALAAAQFPASYEVLNVDLIGNNVTESTWDQQAITGGVGRWQLGGYAATPELDPRVGTTPLIYFGTGATNAGVSSDTRQSTSGRVTGGGMATSGRLTSVTNQNLTGTTAFGYGAVTAVDTVFQLGGQVSGGFTNRMNGGTIDVAPPTLGTFGPQGNGQICTDPLTCSGTAIAPYLPGATIGGAFFFLTGGATGTLAAQVPSNKTFFVLY
ncbi:MAG: hypothetical protein IT370_36015, partial [Deltaproteobacteria bacterium]|nr:hypothetical protein [Deltaproteobacteria bacterium]